MLFLVWWESGVLLTGLNNQHTLLFVITWNGLIFIFLMLSKSCDPSTGRISKNVSRIELLNLLRPSFAHSALRKALRRWYHEVWVVVHHLLELIEICAWLSKVNTMFDRWPFKVADFVFSFRVGVALAYIKRLSCPLLITSLTFFRRKLWER